MELQRCLTSAGIAGYYQPFSMEACRIMICMLDRNYSGKMGFDEFKELWTAINGWKVTIHNHRFFYLGSERRGLAKLETNDMMVWWMCNVTLMSSDDLRDCLVLVGIGNCIQSGID